MAIRVNNLNIEDGTSYIVEEVSFKSVPNRTVFSVPISRRPGDKLTGVEWGNKSIQIKGRIFSTTTSGLRGNIDTLQQNFAVQSLALSIDLDRTYTATLTKLDIPNLFYNQTMAQFDAEFLSVDPFSYANQVTVSGTVISGTLTYSGSITISGTVFAEPLLTINPTGANVGNSGIKNMTITHVPTGENITISGMINYASPFTIDYNNFLTTNSGINTDYVGIFSRWEPGVVNYLITVSSGVLQGFNYTWQYQPRFYN